MKTAHLRAARKGARAVCTRYARVQRKGDAHEKVNSPRKRSKNRSYLVRLHKKEEKVRVNGLPPCSKEQEPRAPGTNAHKESETARK